LWTQLNSTDGRLAGRPDVPVLSLYSECAPESEIAGLAKLVELVELVNQYAAVM
jgi:hypothetical protein